MGDVTVGVCYRLPDQEGCVDEALCRQIGAALRSQALVLPPQQDEVVVLHF